jgi:Ni/Co efflux regulator RcnB
MGHPSSHHYARRPTTHGSTAHYHRPTTHHVYHHASHRHVTIRTHVVHHGHPTAVARTHVNAKVARLRRNVTAARHFHAGLYRAPPGYHYRRWGFGEFLPAIYWGRDYWITDFLAFGLFAPPGGYIWVRYGPDALLIDQYTGEIIQVDYGVFY